MKVPKKKNLVFLNYAPLYNYLHIYLIPNLFNEKKLGVEIDYPYSTEGVSNGKTVVRAMLILWTGDLPAQCEVGKFIFAGKHGCRRDELKGTRFSLIICHHVKNLMSFLQ